MRLSLSRSYAVIVIVGKIITWTGVVGFVICITVRAVLMWASNNRDGCEDL